MAIDFDLLHKLDRREISREEADSIILSAIDIDDAEHFNELESRRLVRSIFHMYLKMRTEQSSPYTGERLSINAPKTILNEFLNNFSVDELSSFSADELQLLTSDAESNADTDLSDFMRHAVSTSKPYHLSSPREVLGKFELLLPYLAIHKVSPETEITILFSIAKTLAHTHKDDSATRALFGELLARAIETKLLSSKLLPYIDSITDLDGTRAALMAKEDPYDSINEIHYVTLIDFMLSFYVSINVYGEDNDVPKKLLNKITHLEGRGLNAKLTQTFLKKAQEETPEAHNLTIFAINNTRAGHFDEGAFQTSRLSHSVDELVRYLKANDWFDVIPTHIALSTDDHGLYLLNLCQYENDSYESECAGGVFRAFRDGTASLGIKKAVLDAVKDCLLETGSDIDKPYRSFYRALKNHGFIPQDHVAQKPMEFRQAIITSDLFLHDKMAETIDESNLLIFLLDENLGTLLDKAIKSGHNPNRPVFLTRPGIIHDKSYDHKTERYKYKGKDLSIICQPSIAPVVSDNLLNYYGGNLYHLYNTIGEQSSSYATYGVGKETLKTLRTLFKHDLRNTFDGELTYRLTCAPFTLPELIKSTKAFTYNDFSAPLPISNLLIYKDRYFSDENAFFNYATFLIKRSIESGVDLNDKINIREERGVGLLDDKIIFGDDPDRSIYTVREIVEILDDERLTSLMSFTALNNEQVEAPPTRKKLRL